MTCKIVSGLLKKQGRDTPKRLEKALEKKKKGTKQHHHRKYLNTISLTQIQRDSKTKLYFANILKKTKNKTKDTFHRSFWLVKKQPSKELAEVSVSVLQD